MAVPIGPIIQAVAPMVAEIAKEAIPAFTRKPAPIAESDPVLVKQIQELQEAATQNAESIQTLAEKLQLTMEGLEEASAATERQLKTYGTMLYVALAVSGLSLVLVVYLLAR